MLKSFHPTLVLIFSMLLLSGCGTNPQDKDVAQADTTGISEQPVASQPKNFSAETVFEVFRNNHVISETDGCITTFTMAKLDGELTMLCGTSAENVTKVTMEHIGMSDNDLTFRFRYFRTASGTIPDEVKTVIFAGMPIVVFENAVNRTTTDG